MDGTFPLFRLMTESPRTSRARDLAAIDDQRDAPCPVPCAREFRRVRRRTQELFRRAFRFLCEEQENAMNKDRVEGSAHQAKGGLKEAAGKVTGDSKLETEGKAEKTAGKVQNTVGGIKDTLKEATDQKSH
jgi:uncharacterized protein YjbJ (UPF0337 family)